MVNSEFLLQKTGNEKKWPDALKVGGGAKGMALLKDVTIIYELWRNMNGFPPDFYKATPKGDSNSKDKNANK
jgi:hypothetical protein